ncbi:MAG: HEAT repeat domain-containing protein [Planctomycetaceae bacterium]|nr:HEAT repeat domain-containing protein [Planctomycetaceae bacterium]
MRMRKRWIAATVATLLSAAACGCQSKDDRIARNKLRRAVAQTQSKDVATAVKGARAIAENPRGVEALPHLAAALSRPEPEVRRAAAISLSQMGPAAKPALDALKPARNDPDRQVQIAAVFAQLMIEPEATPDLAPLTEALDSPVEADRGQSAFLLGFLGKRASAAIPSLEAAAKKGGRAGDVARASIRRINGERAPVPAMGSSPGKVTE